MHFLKSSFCESKRFVTSPDCFTSEENRWRAFQVGLVLEVRGVRLSDRLATFNILRGFVEGLLQFVKTVSDLPVLAGASGVG